MSHDIFFSIPIHCSISLWARWRRRRAHHEQLPRHSTCTTIYVKENITRRHIEIAHCLSYDTVMCIWVKVGGRRDATHIYVYVNYYRKANALNHHSAFFHINFPSSRKKGAYENIEPFAHNTLIYLVLYISRKCNAQKNTIKNPTLCTVCCVAYQKRAIYRWKIKSSYDEFALRAHKYIY